MKPLSLVPNLIEQVHARLVDAIADGTLVPGERLTQEELAERLMVSRQPVSHALVLLRRQGLVVEQGKRGLSVAPVEPERVRDLYQLRSALDGFAARLAAERVAAGTAPQSEIEAVQERLKAGLDLNAESSTHDWIARDVAFHTAVHALSGNRAIAGTADDLWPHFKRCIGVAFGNADLRNAIWPEHTQIVDRILAADPAGAYGAAVNHTEKAGSTIYRRLSEAHAA